MSPFNYFRLVMARHILHFSLWVWPDGATRDMLISYLLDFSDEVRSRLDAARIVATEEE